MLKLIAHGEGRNSMTRQKSTISGVRTDLYKFARGLRDLKAIQAGPEAIVRRIARRGAGRVTARFLSKLFR